MFVTAGGRPVFAAASTTENICLKLFSDDSKINQVTTESDQNDILKQDSSHGIAGIATAYTRLWGTDCVPDSKVISSGLDSRLRYGLVQYSVNTAIYAFLDVPGVNIYGNYASMLLPKELFQDGGSAYAQSQQPDTTTATSYLKDMGLNKLWGISFTIAMSFLVVVLIIAGFLIMFRSKVGGQTVVTISMALQNVVIGALLALASYAIGGFFLNLSKYLILVIAFMFESTFKGSGYQTIYMSGPWNIASQFFVTTVWGTASSNWNTWTESLKNGFFATMDTVGALENKGDWFGAIQQAFTGALQTVGDAIAFPLLFAVAKIVLGGAILIASIRVFWAVLSTYIKMLIDIIIAPVIFMLSSIPGKQSGYSAWLNRMMKNSIAIPLMFAFLNVAGYMAIAVSTSATGCSGAGKSLLTCVTGGMMPAGTHGGTDWLLLAVGPGAMVAVVMLNMVPTVPSFIEELMSAKSSGAVGKAWGDVKKNLQSLPAIGGLFQ